MMSMHNFTLTNLDTDSISFCKPDFSKFTPEEDERLLKELNSFFPEEIKFAPDGEFEVFIVLRSKNYIMYDGKKIKLKGSGLKSSTLEPELKNMLNEFIDALVFDKLDTLPEIYNKYIQKALNITNIKSFCTKKTLSPTTYKSERKNETDIVDAVKGSEYKSGDKVYLYAKSKVIELDEVYKAGPKKGQQKTKRVKVYGLMENFDGEYDRQCYVDKVLATTKRFSTVIDTSIFKKYEVEE